MVDGESPKVEQRHDVLKEAHQMIASWAARQHVDMKWTLQPNVLHTWDACGTVYSTNFENEITRFPREFLDAFVGKPRRLLNGSCSIVFSTMS